MKQISVRVLYWAQAREAAGVSAEDILLEAPAGIPELMEAVLQKHPGLADLRKAIKIAVNGELSGSTLKLSEGDEVALLPPVSGG